VPKWSLSCLPQLSLPCSRAFARRTGTTIDVTGADDPLMSGFLLR